jgi:multiple sugar transport system permease protein
MSTAAITTRPLFSRRRARNPLVTGLARHVVLIVVLVVMLYPVVWMVAASFRPSAEVMNSLGLFSKHYTLDNYKHGWNAGQLDFSRYFLNSIAITALSIAGNLFSCSLTAYAFARLKFPFKRVLFGLLLATMLLPYHVTLVPQYILFNRLAWMNTYLPLVVPKWLGVEAFFIFLMVQFIRTLPRELDDAARIDGCGHWRTFSRIIMPLALPAIGTTALFTFINSWNDFLGPLLYLNKPELWTVSLGLNSFLDVTGESAYGSLFAMSTLALAPIVGFFLGAQKLLIEGVATTGLK